VGFANLHKLRQQFEQTLRARGVHDRETQMLRDSLAIQYRNAGEPRQADELYRESGICEHLKPVEDYIRSLGIRVRAMGSYWSHNCRTWVFFENAMLDAEALKTKFNLPDFVSGHTHLGTHDGSEHGLVCDRDHDALMGVHPDDAQTARVVR
jgi:hypothetical protein